MIKAYNAKQWEIPAILEGRKTCTRRIIKNQPSVQIPDNHNYCKMPLWTNEGVKTLHYMDVLEQNPFKQVRYFKSFAPYEKGNILYVRETWCQIKDIPQWKRYSRPYPDITSEEYVYKADNVSSSERGVLPPHIKWHPSIHMPKEAARIWLKVTDVRVERLQDITEEQAKAEGAVDNCGFIHSPDNEYSNIHTAREHFQDIWDSTVDKKQLDTYGWAANPWVWVIEFKRCEKPKEGGTE